MREVSATIMLRDVCREPGEQEASQSHVASIAMN